ncbi:exosortase family protein XrtF [Nonlabens arenilitoris]|uniref:Exosortase family protein XrtF n=1 Tax=Nonlabens arenilitoris TaxID=1217969 RepID=A0A2S7U7Q6_9FLAO|nr:exosortase family protein XrtF [Nonlabens arenilitoris]PQJ31008.1 exosortase family protein XrtF [Nonlabens arenilitoris]
MMGALRTYIPVFKFVATFGIIYIVLSLIYYLYLQQDYNSSNYPDPVTSQVSFQTQQLLIALGYDAQISNVPHHPSVYMYLDKTVVYRVIEGCNAISVMILFVAFVLAFAKAWKKTVLFIITGVIFIYLVNLSRLVALAVIKYKYPQYDHISHDILFPAVIYGSVILLWLLWIKKPKQT